MVDDIVALSILGIFVLVSLFSIYRVGIKPGIQELIAGLRLLWEGPPAPQRLEHYTRISSCKVLHDIARTETELYGEILSGSAAGHIKDCKIRHEAIKPTVPNRPDNCLHEWEEVERLDGHRTGVCTRCGTMRQYRGV